MKILKFNTIYRITVFLIIFLSVNISLSQDDPRYTTPLKDFPLEVYHMRMGRYQASINNNMSRDLLPSVSSAADLPWSLRPGETYWKYSVGQVDNISIDYYMCKDWEDPNGTIWPYTYVFDSQEGTRDIKYVVKLNDGKWIHNYVRYPLTQCELNGEVTNRSEISEEVNPIAIDAVPTTAEQYVESKVLTNVGLEFTRKLYQWSHFQDNNYIIVEMIIKNVGYGWGEDTKLIFGNFKPVKVPDQTIHGFMFGLKTRAVDLIHRYRPNQYPWIVHYGFRQGDSLRILYAYDGQMRDKDYDSIGKPLTGEDGRLTNYMGQFMCILHADKSVDDRSDDITQPRYTSSTPNWAHGQPKLWNRDEMERKYRYIIDPTFQNYACYDGTDIWPGLHEINTDERGFWVPQNAYEYQWARSFVGPYEIPLGDSIRIVYAVGSAGLDPATAWKVGRDWKNEKCTFNGSWQVPLIPPEGMSDNDYAKDAWVFTEIDSLFKTASRAKWNWEHGFNIPVPPPPPSWFKIEEKVGHVELSWADNAESSSNFEGYRIYRAKGYSDTTLYSKIFECSRSAGNITHEYFDNNLDRGRDYYYYITSFSIANGPNAYKPGEILESGRYYIEAPKAAHYIPQKGLAYPNWVDSVRIVPNPYNISAAKLQFGTGNETDKIAFYNLPEVCTIRIFSENGNLVTTIEHTSGYSDALWVEGGQYMLSDSGQRIVSGIYIAHIQTPDGKTAIRKFVVVR